MSDALTTARAALGRYDDVAPHGYGAGNHGQLATALRALIAKHERLTAPPTDAEVEAASRAYSGELVVGSGDGWDAMRAALEAAREVIA